MNTNFKKSLGTLGVAASLALGFGTAVQAQSETGVELQPQTYDGVTVVKGGVTLDEAAAVKRMASKYPLRVVISGRGGDYYIPDQLTIWRDGQKVTEIPEAGPWLLMDLPAGRYTLQGNFGGTTLKRDVTVSHSGQTVHWVVPASLS